MSDRPVDPNDPVANSEVLRRIMAQRAERAERQNDQFSRGGNVSAENVVRRTPPSSGSQTTNAGGQAEHEDNKKGRALTARPDQKPLPQRSEGSVMDVAHEEMVEAELTPAGAKRTTWRGASTTRNKPNATEPSRGTRIGATTPPSYEEVDLGSKAVPRRKKRGPKTPEGRLAVRLNASTHGILSPQPIVNAYENPQD
jgi:hypothetical protein